MKKKSLNLFLLVQELFEKLKEAEESHSSLQAECDQYRTVLAETVIHKHLCLVYIIISISKYNLSSFSGGNAEASAEECRGRRASMEV